MNKDPTFHIFGGTGLIGSALANECKKRHYNTCLYSSSGYSTLGFDLVKGDYCFLASRFKPNDFVVNLAAIAQPKLVRQNKEYSYLVNVMGNSKLFDCTAEAGCKYFLMSSVEVFDGRVAPLTEETSKNPINEYGRQKSIAEDYLLSHTYDNYVIGRTSWNVSSTNTGRCLIPFMIESLKLDDAKMATDNIFTIASAKETSRVIIDSLLSGLKGLVHIASPEPISRFEIAEIIIRSYWAGGLACKPCLFRDIRFEEPRSRLNILDVRKSIKELNVIYSEPVKIIEQRVHEINYLESLDSKYV
jgi:dTDP-4-dehydrorhamnose reductase